MATNQAKPTEGEGNGVSEFHESQLTAFLKFSGVKRNEALRSVEVAFREVVESPQLSDDTRMFTVDEVKDLISGARDSVRADVQRELVHTSHMTALVLKQLFSQAEDILLDLHVDVSALENEFLLSEVSAIDPSIPQQQSTTRLKPLSKTTSGSAVQHALDKKARSDDRFRQLQTQCTEILRAKTALQAEIDHLRDELKKNQQPPSGNQTKAQPKQTSTPNPPPIVDSTEIVQLNAKLQEARKLAEEERAHAQRAEAELLRKVQQTAPFLNMRKMIKQKNDTVRQLKDLLKKHAPGVALPGIDDSGEQTAETDDS